MGALTVVGILIIAGICATIVAIDQDLVAVNLMGIDNLDLHEPIGAYNKIGIDDFRDRHPMLDAEFQKIPHINDIKYGIYETKYSANDVMDDYDNLLSSLGYGLQKRGFTVFVFPFKYCGYVKWGVAVGILATDEIPGYDTLVLYTTGLSLHYNDIRNYFDEKLI